MDALAPRRRRQRPDDDVRELLRALQGRALARGADRAGDAPAVAFAAGLKSDDLIVYIDGELVSSIKIFREIIAQTQPNDELVLEVQRGKKLMTLKMKLAQQPK